MRFWRSSVLPCALFVTLILDGSFALYLHRFFPGVQLLPIAIMLINMFDDANPKEFWLALVAGIVADIYFFSFIGIYTIFFPLCSWIFQRLARVLSELFWLRLVVVSLGAGVLSIYSWFILKITGFSSIAVSQELFSLLPTLIGTLLFTAATHWIWQKLATKYPFMGNFNIYW